VPRPSLFNYSIVRVVPAVERGECLNAGVILFCRTRRYLGARVELDPARLLALWPGADVETIRSGLDLIPQVAAGQGPIGELSLSERFHWLVSPRSTTIQPSPVHAGLCTDPEAMLEHLMATLVRLG
jgi:hypothetical protein